jgi:hypothetical protein
VAHRSSAGRAIRLAGGHREGWERERGRSDCVGGAFTGDGEAVKSDGGGEALRRRFGHGEEELLVGMDTAWSGGAHGDFI